MPGEVPFLDFQSQRNVHNLVRRFSDVFEQEQRLWWMYTLGEGETEVITAISAFVTAQQQSECTSKDAS